MTVVLENYRDDPVGFVEEVLGQPPPYEKQREILRTVAVKRRVSVVGANGSGKDWAAARAVLWWLSTRPRAIALVTGPTQRQVEQIVWRELRAAHKASQVPLGGRLYGSQWNIADDRFAIGFSTNKADNLQGFHSPELLVVVTEAHAMPQDQMEALKRLYPARMLLTGNAFSRDGEFFDSHHTKRHIYACITVSVYDTPNFTGEYGGVPGMPTEEDIEERKLEWGEDHPLYQGSILARFPDMLDDSLLSRTAIEAAVDRWEHACHSERSEAEPRNLSGDASPCTEACPEGCFDSASGSAQHDKGATCHPERSAAPHTCHSERSEAEPRNLSGDASPCTEACPEGCFDSASGSAQHDKGATCHPERSAAPHTCHSERSEAEPRNLSGAHPAVDERSPRDVSTTLNMTLLPPSTQPRLGVDVAPLRLRQDRPLRAARLAACRVPPLLQRPPSTPCATAGEAVTPRARQRHPRRLRGRGRPRRGASSTACASSARPVHGVQFGGKARQSGRFANMRAEIFWELRRLFNDQLIAIPRDEGAHQPAPRPQVRRHPARAR